MAPRPPLPPGMARPPRAPLHGRMVDPHRRPASAREDGAAGDRGGEPHLHPGRPRAHVRVRRSALVCREGGHRKGTPNRHRCEGHALHPCRPVLPRRPPRHLLPRPRDRPAPCHVPRGHHHQRYRNPPLPPRCFPSPLPRAARPPALPVEALLAVLGDQEPGGVVVPPRDAVERWLPRRLAGTDGTPGRGGGDGRRARRGVRAGRADAVRGRARRARRAELEEVEGALPRVHHGPRQGVGGGGEGGGGNLGGGGGEASVRGGSRRGGKRDGTSRGDGGKWNRILSAEIIFPDQTSRSVSRRAVRCLRMMGAGRGFADRRVITQTHLTPPRPAAPSPPPDGRAQRDCGPAVGRPPRRALVVDGRRGPRAGVETSGDVCRPFMIFRRPLVELTVGPMLVELTVGPDEEAQAVGATGPPPATAGCRRG